MAEESITPGLIRSVRDWAAAAPDEVAIATPHGVTTAGELWDTARRIAGWLRVRGVPADAVIAADVPPELDPVMLAALMIRGGRSASSRPGLPVGPDEVVTHLITPRLRDDVPATAQLLFDQAAAASLALIHPGLIEPAHYAPDEVQRIFWSSGTTGAPKGIAVTAGALEARRAQRDVPMLAAERPATMMQLASASGQGLFAMVASQRQPFIRAEAAADFLALAAEYHIDSIDGSPHQLAGLLAAAQASGEHLPHLRQIISQGAALSTRQAELLAEWFGAAVYDLLGSSEAAFVQARLVAGGQVGTGRYARGNGLVVEVVDDAGAPVPDGTTGQLRIATPGLFAGYVGAGTGTDSRRLSEGWFTPGDMARIQDGVVEILGRADDVLNIGGRKILAGTIEAIATAHPGVSDAVAAVVHSRYGVPRLAVACVSSSPIDVDKLADDIERDAAGLRPSLLMRLAELPRSADGKPRRAEVATQLQERFDVVDPDAPPEDAPATADEDGAVLTPVRALRDWATEEPDALAVVADNWTMTARELWDTARRIAGWMRGAGADATVPTGTSVAPHWGPVFLIAGLIRGGVTAQVPGSAPIGASDAIHVLVTASTRVDLPDDSQLVFDAPARAAMRAIDPDAVVPARYHPSELARLSYSSGTSGVPKAIRRTARGIEARIAARTLGGLAAGRFATLLHGSSMHAQTAVMQAIMNRHPYLVLRGQPADLPLLRDHRIASLSASPAQLVTLLAHARATDEHLPELRRIFSTGGTIDPHVAQQLAAQFGAEVYDTYGATETSTISTRRADPPSDARARLDEGVEAEIVDDAHTPLPDGAEGRLRTRTPWMGDGYASGADELGPHLGFHDGWFYSGDYARITGRELELLGRDDDRLNLAGTKVSAPRIEAVVRTRSEVTDAVAVEVTHADGSARLGIAYTGAPLGADATLRENLRADLGFDLLSAVVRVPELPLTDSGKPRRAEIAAQVQAVVDARERREAPPSAPSAPAWEDRPPARAALSPVLAARAWARESPGELAVRGHHLKLSIGELWDTSVRIAGWIRSLGIPRDAGIGAALPPDLEPAFLLGLLIAGNPGASVRGNAQAGPGTPLRYVVTSAVLPWMPAEHQIVLNQAAFETMAKIDPGEVAIAEFAPDDVVRIAYSSGTTGSPKAIAGTAQSFEIRIAEGRRRIGPTQTSTTLQPMTTWGTQRRMLTALVERRPHLVIGGSIPDSLPLLDELQFQRVDGSPFQLDTLLLTAQRRNVRLPALQEMRSVGAPLPHGLAQALADWFGVAVYDGYGSNEVGHVTERRADGVDPSTAPGGTLLDGVEVEVVDDDHRPLPDGETGRVRTRAPGMAPGYLGTVPNDPHRGFIDGWFYPGDLGQLRGNVLTILGRDDGIMNVGGMKLLPEEVEAAVLRHPGVRDAVAAIVVDRLGVNQLGIALVGEPEDDVTTIATKLRGPLGGIAPSIIVRMKEIPRTDTGKPLRDAIATQLQQRMDASGPII